MRATCYAGLRRVYGLTRLRFVPARGGSVTKLIESGKATGGDVFATDAVLKKRKKWAILDDPRAVFGFQNVAPVVSKQLVAQLGARFTATVNAVSKQLTQDAMIKMNKEVTVKRKAPSAVARAFLVANKLV
jgi:osmoprotectant transport system substrate-binding protein